MQAHSTIPSAEIEYIMSGERIPQWRPIKDMPMLTYAIDGMLQTANENYITLQEAIPKPYVLDDYTVNRVIKAFTTQQADLPLFDEQLRRWQATKLTHSQNQEVARLLIQLGQLRETITKILTLAQQLKKGTIEAVLGKSDEQVGLEALMKPPPPKRKP